MKKKVKVTGHMRIHMIIPYLSHPRQAEALCHQMISTGGAAGARIDLRRQNALRGLQQLADEVDAGAEQFDLCFIDADKELGDKWRSITKIGNRTR